MASSRTKSSPLETYLTTVAPVNDDKDPSNPDKDVSSKAGPQQSKPVDSNWEEGAHAVILTILNNNPKMTEAELRDRSEFSSHLYRDVVAKLTDGGFIANVGGMYHLTDAGKAAAKRQRDRLIGF